MSNQLRLLFFIVVISGALCTVEDYVIMSQCAHNRAIHVAAEGTVSVTDISQTQNITIVGLPDYVNNDFKIALFAKETQRYLCFNDNWKLVGMRELQNTCYFNETIVHGYFVFRSVVDLQRRVGFTHRGKAIGPKKNFNDACYLFTKIPADQFFHQHSFSTSTSTSSSATSTSRASYTTTTTAANNRSKASRNKNNNNNNYNRTSGMRNNSNNNQNQQHSNGHSSNISSYRTNNNSSVNTNLSNTKQQQQLILSQQNSSSNTREQQHHQVRHHHNDPNFIARRQQHEHKQKRRQRNRTRATASPVAPTIATKQHAIWLPIPSTQTAFSTSVAAAAEAAATTTISRHMQHEISPTHVVKKPPTTTFSAASATSNTLTTTTTVANKRKGRRRKGERWYKKHQLQQKQQHDLPHYSKDTQQRQENIAAKPMKATSDTDAYVASTAYDDVAGNMSIFPTDWTSLEPSASTALFETILSSSATATDFVDASTVTTSEADSSSSSISDSTLSESSDIAFSTTNNNEMFLTTDISATSTMDSNNMWLTTDITAASANNQMLVATPTIASGATSTYEYTLDAAADTWSPPTSFSDESELSSHNEQFLSSATPYLGEVTIDNVANELPTTYETKLNWQTTHVADDNDNATTTSTESDTSSIGSSRSSTSSAATEPLLETEETTVAVTVAASDDFNNRKFVADVGNFSENVVVVDDFEAVKNTTTSTTTSNIMTDYIYSTRSSNIHKHSTHRNISNHANHQQLLKSNTINSHKKYTSDSTSSTSSNIGQKSHNRHKDKMHGKSTIAAAITTQEHMRKTTAALSPTSSTATFSQSSTSLNPLQQLFSEINRQQQQNAASARNDTGNLLSINKNINNSNTNNTISEPIFGHIAATTTTAAAATTATVRTTKKSLRKSTQRLLATPFHQLTYVRNGAGDIDIDNIDNISVYPDLGETDDISDSSFDDNTNKNNNNSSNNSRSNSRLTIVSGYFPTSATATLPESIRIAKIKINNERKRMLLRQQQQQQQPQTRRYRSYA